MHIRHLPGSIRMSRCFSEPCFGCMEGGDWLCVALLVLRYLCYV
jgi:hypothetical protein